jgi:hypothetical protein
MARLIGELGFEDFYLVNVLDCRWKEPKAVAMRVHAPVHVDVPKGLP